MYFVSVDVFVSVDALEISGFDSTFKEEVSLGVVEIGEETSVVAVSCPA